MDFTVEELQNLSAVLANQIINSHQLSPMLTKIQKLLVEREKVEQEAQETLNAEG